MGDPISFEEPDFRIVASIEERRRVLKDGAPFRICIMGDFSGRANRGVSLSAFPRPVELDRDNLEDVMAQLGVQLDLPVAGNDSPCVTIRFAELEDFHPDRLYARLEVFRSLRDTRSKLRDLRTFESARKEIRSWSGTTEPPESGSAEPSPPSVFAGETSGGVLDRIVGETQDRRPGKGEVSRLSGWDAFLRSIVGPYLVPGHDREQAELVAAVDASISGLMNRILHHPDFQSVEASWRALRFLVQRVETNERLRVYVVDISKAELALDLRSSDNIEKTDIYRLLVEQAVVAPGAEPWAVLAGDYRFDQNREDVETLARMATVAKLAGAPFVSGVRERVLGCDCLADTPDPDDWKCVDDSQDRQAWDRLRQMPESSYLGLVLPRFLLRLPYGADTDPVDGFDFEEMTEVPDHEKYLWGNPSIVCLVLLAQAFSNFGWDFRPGVVSEISGFPLHVYREQGEFVTKPCAEVVFSEKAMERVLAAGVMPLLSVKDQDAVRLARFQALSNSLQGLAGPWD